MRHLSQSAVVLLLCVAAAAGRASAQTPASEVSGTQAPAAPAPGEPSPFGITDNAFVVEEAFNQDPGVIQTLLAFTRTDQHNWAVSLVQEWPLFGHRNQIAFGFAYVDVGTGSGIGDVSVAYRYQLLDEGPGRPAVSPRLTVLFPTGNATQGRGSGVVGWQVALPVSKRLGRVYLHGNVGVTTLPGTHSAPQPDQPMSDGDKVTLVSPFVGGSAILAVRPMLNLLLESQLVFQSSASDTGGTVRNRLAILSPGIRGGWDFPAGQLVLGAAVPITFQDGQHTTAALAYVSWEGPFR